MGQELALADAKIADSAAVISPCSVLTGLAAPPSLREFPMPLKKISNTLPSTPCFSSFRPSRILDVEKVVHIVGTIHSFRGSCTYKNGWIRFENEYVLRLLSNFLPSFDGSLGYLGKSTFLKRICSLILPITICSGSFLLLPPHIFWFTHFPHHTQWIQSHSSPRRTCCFYPPNISSLLLKEPVTILRHHSE